MRQYDFERHRGLEIQSRQHFELVEYDRLIQVLFVLLFATVLRLIPYESLEVVLEFLEFLSVIVVAAVSLRAFESYEQTYDGHYLPVMFLHHPFVNQLLE